MAGAKIGASLLLLGLARAGPGSTASYADPTTSSPGGRGTLLAAAPG